MATLYWSIIRPLGLTWAMISMQSSDGILAAAVSNSAASKMSQSSVGNSMLGVVDGCGVSLNKSSKIKYLLSLPGLREK